MEKSRKDITEHNLRTMKILNELANEYKVWNGLPADGGFGRNVAMGEYILELCEMHPHDSWLDIAKDAFLEWKLKHHIKVRHES